MTFKWGEFISAAGMRLSWKLEMDTLTAADWDCLAQLVGRTMGPFGEVIGVPTGGERFAAAIKRVWGDGVARPYTHVLIVDDVLTTGASMERVRAGRGAKGVVVFDRSGGKCPGWITPIFRLDGTFV